MKKLVYWLFAIVVVLLLVVVVKRNPNSVVGATVNAMVPSGDGESQGYRLNFESDKQLMRKIVGDGKWNMKYDEFQEVMFVQHDYEVGENFVMMYLVSKNTSEDRGVNDIRMVIMYYGDDWVFWDKVTFLVDGKRFEFDYSMERTNRDANGGSVSEYYDVLLNEEESFRKAISNCVTIKYRLSGKQWYERELQKEEIEDLKEAVKLYDLVSANRYYIGDLSSIL